MERKPLIASPVWLLHRAAARDGSFSGRGGKSDQKKRREKNHLLVVVEQIHILIKISASSPADLSHTEETDASETPERHKYSNANNSLCPVQEKSFAFILNKSPKNGATSDPCGVCQSCRWQHTQLPITRQTHVMLLRWLRSRAGTPTQRAGAAGDPNGAEELQIKDPQPSRPRPPRGDVLAPWAALTHSQRRAHALSGSTWLLTPLIVRDLLSFVLGVSGYF